MLKEIHEQPRAVADTLRGAPAARGATTPTWTGSSSTSRRCGGSCCSPAAPRTTPALVGKFLIEAAGAHPVRGRPGQRVPLPRSDRRPGRPGRRHLPVRRDGRHAGGGQGGAGARRARAGDLQRGRLGHPARVATASLYTHAGPGDRRRVDQGFTTQLAALALLAIHLGPPHRHARARARAAKLVDELSRHARPR